MPGCKHGALSEWGVAGGLCLLTTASGILLTSPGPGLLRFSPQALGMHCLLAILCPGCANLEGPCRSCANAISGPGQQ